MVQCRIALGSSAAAQEQLDQVEIPLTEPKPDDSPPPEVDLARIAPLKVTLEEVVDEGKGAGLLAAVLQVIPERVLAPPQKGLPTPIRQVGSLAFTFKLHCAMHTPRRFVLLGNSQFCSACFCLHRVGRCLHLACKAVSHHGMSKVSWQCQIY